MRPTCENCREPLPILARKHARTCSTRCRVALHRARKRLPVEMTNRRTWVRADGKRPIRINGKPASSTKRWTWATYAEVMASTAGDGFGVMLGDGLACYDLDHISDARARAFMGGLTERVVFAERSRSGRGVHIFVEAPEGPGYRRDGVEFYSRGRFIRLTGTPFH